MSKPLPSVDELMWLLAEQPDPAALDAFAKRYPEHRAELLKRVRMVRELKAADPGQERPAPPRFQKRAVHEPRSRKALTLAVACLSLAAVAFGAHRITAAVVRRPEPQPQPDVAMQPGPEVRPDPLRQLPRRDRPSIIMPPLEWGPVERAVDRKVTIDMKAEPLANVLNEIARLSGVRLEIAPGLESPLVDAAYTETPSLMALQDMGRSLGFTVFPQGDHSVLIVPAVDPGASQTDAPTGETKLTEDDPEAGDRANSPQDAESS